jgi:hypothetical protein
MEHRVAPGAGWTLPSLQLWRSLSSHTMAFVYQSRLVVLLLAATVAVLPVAPPEHVHDAAGHGSEDVLVHRHLAAHDFSHRSAHHDGVLDDDDAPILTLDTVYTVPAAFTLLGAPSVAVVFVERPGANLIGRTPEYYARPIHGPPRAPAGLRAPPFLARL